MSLSLSEFRTLVQTATGRKDVEFLATIDQAVNWAALLAAILFKPYELEKESSLTLSSGASTVSLASLTRWLKMLRVHNTTDDTRVWVVPNDLWDIVVPTLSVIKYCTLRGATVTFNTSVTGDRVFSFTYQGYPAVLVSSVDVLEFGGHDSFIVSVATGIVWTFLEEGESATVMQKLAEFVTTPFQLDTEERNLLEGRWRTIHANQSSRVSS